MFPKPSLARRIALGKGLGLLVGLAEMLSLPLFTVDPSWLLRWGVLLWYVTFGALVGLFGVIDTVPLPSLRLRWWLRAPFMGAWMNFVLSFFAYDTFATIMRDAFGPDGLLASPFWFVLEGAVVALAIDYVATRFGGEGRETVGR